MSFPYAKYILTTAILSTLSLPTLAQSTNPVEIHGGFDFYYQTSPQAHRPVPATAAGPAVLEGRYFDRHSNVFTLNMAEVSVQRKSNTVSWRVDLGAGEMVDQLSGGGSQSVTSTNPTNLAANEPSRNILQALLTYQLSPQWSVTVGKFFTPIGFEGTRAKDNLQYSRSYLFNFGPFWHEGLIITYKAMPDLLTVNAYLLNSWDGRLSTEGNDSPAVIANLNFTPSSQLALNYNYFNGKESVNQSTRQLHELNALWTINDSYAVATDIQYATQEIPGAEQASWEGVAVYAKAVFGNYTFSPRYEYFKDTDGYTIVGALSMVTDIKQTIQALTLTNSYNFGEGLEGRFELRHDQTNRDGFFTDKNADATRTQDSATLALLYSF